MAGNPPAAASQPPGMNGMIVTVPMKVAVERPEDAQRLVPEPEEQQHAECPFQHAQKQCGAAHAEQRVEPKDQWAMTDKGDQAIHLIREPLLVSEEKENDHHRRAEQMVLGVVSQ